MPAINRSHLIHRFAAFVLGRQHVARGLVDHANDIHRRVLGHQDRLDHIALHVGLLGEQRRVGLGFVGKA